MIYNLNNLPIKILKSNCKNNKMTFILNNKKYYFKSLSDDKSFIYYELIAKKIADKLGVKCCNSYYATYGGKEGVISEYITDERYVSMHRYLSFHYHEEADNKSSLEDIWNTFSKDFSNQTVKRLMDELVKIFIFDILIANRDRHTENYGLILDGDDTLFAPLFDNEKMLLPLTMRYGLFWIGVNNEDFAEGVNILEEFLFQSSYEYTERLSSKLDTISEESILIIINEIKKEGINIEDNYIKKILRLFNENRKILLESIEQSKKSHKRIH